MSASDRDHPRAGTQTQLGMNGVILKVNGGLDPAGATIDCVREVWRGLGQRDTVGMGSERLERRRSGGSWIL